MSDMFGGGSTYKSPDIQANARQAEGIYNQVLSSTHPSASAMDQVATMQNTMGNQAYNTGLSGSTIEQQQLGAGETSAFDADQMKQVAAILGLTGGVTAGQLSPDKMNMAQQGQLMGMLGSLGGDAAMIF